MTSMLKQIVATIIGLWLGIFGLFFLLGIMVVIFPEFDTKFVAIRDPSFLHLRLDGPIPDRSPVWPPLSHLSWNDLFVGDRPIGLNTIIDAIKQAEKNEKIKGMLLEIQTDEISLATLQELHNRLTQFRERGKKLWVYAENLNQSAYFLASAADKIILHPEGGFELHGLAAESLFFKGTLDKLDLEPQIIRQGRYKSAIEPLIREQMSDENREQTKVLIEGLWKEIVQTIADTRTITLERLNGWVNDQSVRTPQQALDNHLIDQIAYRDEVLDQLKKDFGKKGDKEPPLVSFHRYALSLTKNIGASNRPEVAVIYATGEIDDGDGDTDSIGASVYADTIEEITNDDAIKGVVLRINSPGGSAFASDLIWRQVELLKAKKPVIVSMGEVAASGGYYIACGANRIYADPTTITGSIGVFGVLFNLKPMLNQKLGVTIETVKTSPFADLGSSLHRADARELKLMENDVARVYQTFLSHVAQGRNLKPDQVASLAEGRVWSGVDAKRIGLIDEFGGLEDAIDDVANMAGVSDYQISEWPAQVDAITSLISEWSGSSDDTMISKQLEKHLGIPSYVTAQKWHQVTTPQARMIYHYKIH